MVVKTSPQIIGHSFHWEMGLCFCPLKSGLCECFSDRVKVMLSHSELGLEKWAVSVPVCWILIFGTQPPCFEEVQAVQGSIPGLGRYPGEGKGYPVQCSGLENSMDCIVHGLQRVGHNWVTFTFWSLFKLSMERPSWRGTEALDWLQLNSQLTAIISFLVIGIGPCGSKFSLEVELLWKAEPNLPCWALPKLQTHKLNTWVLYFLSH